MFLTDQSSDYRPFLHLRVGRLQPWGLYQSDREIDLRLSEVISVPPTQLVPSRMLEVRWVEQESVNVSLWTGASYFRRPLVDSVRVEATLEQRVGVEDDPLAWRQLGDPVALNAMGSWNERQWVASLALPAGGAAIRVRVDEYEVYQAEGIGDALRLAYTDAINLM